MKEAINNILEGPYHDSLTCLYNGGMMTVLAGAGVVFDSESATYTGASFAVPFLVGGGIDAAITYVKRHRAENVALDASETNPID